MDGIQSLATEQRNANSQNLDELSIVEMLKIINTEDKTVAWAVEKEIDAIAQAVEQTEKAIRNGGRVVYCGCGTSGRLGVLDASECPPTYGVEPDLFLGIIAGGLDAVVKSVEGAEDDGGQCVEDLQKIQFSQCDILIGIAASGRTPYVIAGLVYAQSLGAVTVSVTCCRHSEMAKYSDIAIAPETGAEVVTGSTRMKAGTAQKMVLNMISTGTMVRLGKVFGNLMVDLRPSNQKLVQRAKRIVREVTGCSEESADHALEQSKMEVKVAILIVLLAISAEQAKEILRQHEGMIRKVLQTEGVAARV